MARGNGVAVGGESGSGTGWQAKVKRKKRDENRLAHVHHPLSYTKPACLLFIRLAPITPLFALKIRSLFVQNVG